MTDVPDQKYNTGDWERKLRSLTFPPEYPIHSVRSLVNESFRIMLERVEVLERQVAPISDSIQLLYNGRPVRRAIEQRAKRL